MTERKELIARLNEKGDNSMDGYLLYEAADALEALMQPAVPQEPNNDEVICPACCAQFRAIPVNVQRLLLDAGFEPPFKSSPQQRPRLTDAEIKAIEHETDMKSSIGDWSNCFARAIEAKVRGEG